MLEDAENQYEDDDDNNSMQQSNGVYHHREQIRNHPVVEKISSEEGTPSMNSNEEIPIIRNGAVTQEFQLNSRKKQMMKNLKLKEHQQFEKTNAVSSSMPLGGETQSYNNAQPLNKLPQMDYFQQRNIYNEMADKGGLEGNNRMTISRINVKNPTIYEYNQMVDVRFHEQAMLMSEMMNSMLMFQQSNFKTMMDSHTHLMSKLIDKTKPRRRRKRYSDSNKE